MFEEFCCMDVFLWSKGFGVFLDLLVGWRWTHGLDLSNTRIRDQRSVVSSTRVCDNLIMDQLGHDQGSLVVATVAAHCWDWLDVLGI